MIDKLAGLWDTKRWLFWLLLPITIIAVGVKYYLDYLEYKSEKDMERAKSEAQKLRFKQRQARQAAKKKKEEADKLEKKIEDRKEEDIDIDWHLKD